MWLPLNGALGCALGTSVLVPQLFLLHRQLVSPAQALMDIFSLGFRRR